MTQDVHATPPERFALLLVIVCAVALSAVRINTTDTPWHLATARLMVQEGRLPTTNTFSYTHPDYTLYQQYPVYQLLLYTVYSVGGFAGLSVLLTAAWVTIFVLWIRWGGSWNQAALLHLAWMFGLLGLQQRMILRPDVLTILFFVLMLHVFDVYRRGKRSCAVLFVLIQWLMVNSHQLFTVGLATQAIFLIHLLMVRILGGKLGVSDEDRDVPIRPMVAALVSSVAACFATPLGTKILDVARHTAGSLSAHREHVQEFQYVYQSPWALGLAVIAFVLGLSGFLLVRRQWRPFEAGLWVMGATMTILVLRGIVFFVPLSVALFSRSLCRSRWAIDETPVQTDESSEPQGLWLRVLMLGVTLGFAGLIVKTRWISPPRMLGGTQPGLGKSIGDWPDDAVEFLKDHAPPGRMLNLGWYAGNNLIWDLYPERKVFVDPRFETYPRPFLLKCIEAESDDKVLADLIDDYEPLWLVGELRLKRVRRRLRRLLDDGEWSLVFFDTVFAVLVRHSPDTEPYRQEHSFSLETWEPPGLAKAADLRGLQLIRLAGVYADLGAPDRASSYIEESHRLAAAAPVVAAALHEFLADPDYVDLDDALNAKGKE